MLLVHPGLCLAMLVMVVAHGLYSYLEFWFLPPLAFLDAMRARPHREGFQVSFSLFPPRPVSEVCSVFKKQVLPSNSYAQSRIESLPTVHLISDC